MYRKVLLILASVLLSCTGAACEGAGDIASDMASDFNTMLGIEDTPSGGPSGSGSVPSGTSDPAVFASSEGNRDSTPAVLTPVHDGSETCGNEVVTIDTSDAANGYISVLYTGTNNKVKFRITGSDGVTYTYLLTGGYDVFPLSDGSDTYTLDVYENVQGNEYIKAYTTSYTATVTNEFGAWLYPNQYVNFTEDSQVVSKAEQLAASADSDLDVLTNIYNFIIGTITYDYEKAETVVSGYVPDPDEILRLKTGICLDYASVMCCMLRSQSIPCRLEVGYVDGDAYHAWISVYLDEIGWVNGVVEFDGVSWKMMDPTFASSMKEESLRKYIGNGTNYSTKYIY